MKNILIAIVIVFLLLGITNHYLSGSLIILQSTPENVTVWIDGKYYDTQEGYLAKFDKFPENENFEIDGASGVLAVFKIPEMSK